MRLWWNLAKMYYRWCLGNEKAPQTRGFFVATQATRSVLIENAMYRTLLATCGSTEMKCINKASLNWEASCLWRHQESNWDTRLLSRKNAPQRLRGVSKVVPPGIVIYTQVALYLHFEELPNPQSPPIAPPQNCVVLHIVKADDFVWQRYNFRVRNRKD